MSTIAIRLPSSLIKDAEKYASLTLRTTPKQIEYWARLGRCAEDNPDLSLDFIKDCMLGLEDIENNRITPFEFRER